MQEFIISFMNRYGYLGILFLITIENLFPPIPSEVILTMGGFMTTYTSMHITGVIVFSTFGSLLGAIILYYIGKLLNRERLIRIASGKIGKVLRLNAEDIDKSIDWFYHKGNKTVFFCRFVPILRSLISIPAGMSEMNPTRFLVYTTTGSVIWNTVLIWLGCIVGESWDKISLVLRKYSHLTRFVLIALCLFFLYRHFSKKGKESKDKE